MRDKPDFRLDITRWSTGNWTAFCPGQNKKIKNKKIIIIVIADISIAPYLTDSGEQTELYKMDTGIFNIPVLNIQAENKRYSK